MNPAELLLALEALAPRDTGEVLRKALTKHLESLPEDERRDFILGLFGGAENDKVASVVHL